MADLYKSYLAVLQLNKELRSKYDALLAKQEGKEEITMSYGKELIIDLHECDPATFTRESIENYFRALCKLIDMERCKLHFWDDVGVPEWEKQTEPHLKGTSAIQFITTSNVTIHALDLLGEVYVNIFSCKEFNDEKADLFTIKHFEGKPQATPRLVVRGRCSRR